MANERFGWDGDDLKNGGTMTPEQVLAFEGNRDALKEEIERTDAILRAAGVDPDDPEFGLDVLGTDAAE